MDGTLLKPTLVLMAGLPGAGKTTLAHELGKQLSWPVLDKDWRKLLFLKSGMTDEIAGWFAYDWVFQQTYELLFKQRRSVIIDSSALHEFILSYAAEMAYFANARLRVIHCSVDNAIRNQRLLERLGEYPYPSFDTRRIEHDKPYFIHLPLNRLCIDTRAPLITYAHKAKHYLVD